MRVPFVSLAILLVIALWPLARALAEDGSAGRRTKAPDLQTVNGVTSAVTSAPVDATGGAPRPLAAPAKPKSFETALPPGTAPPSAAQLAKRAELATPAPFAPAPDPAAKAPDVSATLPVPAGVRVATEADWRAPAAFAPRGHSIADVLGGVPRPAWGAGSAAKPKPESTGTVGPATGIDHPAAAAPATGKAPANRPREFSTTKPRDPDAPPPSPVKPAPQKEAGR